MCGSKPFPHFAKLSSRAAAGSWKHLNSDGEHRDETRLFKPSDGVDGALPALKKFCFSSPRTHSVLSSLAEALVGRAVPNLQEISIDMFYNSGELERLADMLEARASIPGCKGLERFEGRIGRRSWFEAASVATQVRLLRALLPTLKELPRFSHWKVAYNQSFQDVQAPYLHELMCEAYVIDGNFSCCSWVVLAAVSALRKIDIRGNESSDNLSPLSAKALQSISEALRYGALKHLVEVELSCCSVSNGILADFIGALEQSGCARRLKVLDLGGCGDLEGVRALAVHLRRDAFPALESLNLGYNPGIADAGSVAVAEALLTSTQTSLQGLSLMYVRMGDRGIAALASAVSQGRLEHLKTLDISEHHGALIKQGIIALAQAIDACGLPRLRILRVAGLVNLTAAGVSAIVHAVVKKCPDVKEILLHSVHHGILNGILEAAGAGSGSQCPLVRERMRDVEMGYA